MLDVQVVVDQLQQRIRLPDVLPQVMRLVPDGIDRIVGVQVEGEEVRVIALQAGGHEDFFVADSEVHQAALELRAAARPWGRRSFWYCFLACSTNWPVSEFFSSAVMMGRPLRKRTRSMLFSFFWLYLSWRTTLKRLPW